jgi:hypothetical protein
MVYVVEGVVQNQILHGVQLMEYAFQEETKEGIHVNRLRPRIKNTFIYFFLK